MTTNTKKPKTTQATADDKFIKEAQLAKYRPLLDTAGGALIPLHLWDDVLVQKNGTQKPLGKAPVDANWTSKPYDSAKTIKECLRSEYNVGYRIPADVLVIDVDPRNGGDRGFQKLCFTLGLDPDEWPRVITGSGGWHCYMSKPADVLIRDTLDNEDYKGVEFKSKGRQVVAAGSRHPDGGYYRWSEDHPSLAAGLPMIPTVLLTAITRPAREAVEGGGQMDQTRVAAALAQLDVTKFRDHDKWLQLMMAVHHASAGDARQEFVEWSTSDSQYDAEADAIGHRWDSLHANRNDGVTYKTLNMILRNHGASNVQVANQVADDDFPDDIEQDLDFDTPAEQFDFDTPAEKRESKLYTETKLPELLDFAEVCIVEAGAPVYQMGGRLVHPVRAEKDSEDSESIRRKAGALTIGGINQHRCREYMIEHAPFHKLVKDPETAKLKPKAFPATMGLAAHYLARGDKWRLPVINGIIETPTLRRDGTILEDEGFDPQSGLLLDMGGVKFPTIPQAPTRDDAVKALARIKEPFTGFPFVSNAMGKSASRSVMLSAVLTALIRRTLHSAPLHATSAPTMGTGKSLAIDVVSLIATGRLTTAMSQGNNEEEDQKRLFSVFLQGDLIVSIDNVMRPIESESLATVLTQASWQNRILGESRNVEVKTNSLIMASGNNLMLKGDMTTRALLCRMDAGVEKPEQRRFTVDLKQWVPDHRVELVVAGLTVLRAFVVAGRPGLDKLTPFGRFEDWSNLVRGALVWLGEPDPAKTRSFIAVDDPERGDLALLMQAIVDNVGEDPFTAATLMKTGEECSDAVLTDAISNAVPRATAKAFGMYLHARNGKIVGDLRLVGKYDRNKKLNVYRVQPTADAAE